MLRFLYTVAAIVHQAENEILVYFFPVAEKKNAVTNGRVEMQNMYAVADLQVSWVKKPRGREKQCSRRRQIEKYIQY